MPKTLCGPYCMLFGSTAGLTGGLSISSATVSLTVEVVTYELWWNEVNECITCDLELVQGQAYKLCPGTSIAAASVQICCRGTLL